MDSETTSGNKRARFASLDEEELTQFAERQKSYKKLRKDTPSPEENASDTDSIETILYEYHSIEELRDVDDIPLPLDNFFSEGSDQGSDLKRNDTAIEDLAAEENASDTDSIEELREDNGLPFPLDDTSSEGSDQGSDLKRNDKDIENLTEKLDCHNFFIGPAPLISSDTARKEASNRDLSVDCLQFPDISQQEGH